MATLGWFEKIEIIKLERLSLGVSIIPAPEVGLIGMVRYYLTLSAPRATPYGSGGCRGQSPLPVQNQVVRVNG